MQSFSSLCSLLFIVYTFSACKTVNKSNSVVFSDDLDVNYICGDEVIARDDNLNFKFFLENGDKLQVTTTSQEKPPHVYINVIVQETGESIWVAEKYVKEEKCVSKSAMLPSIDGKKICAHTWEELKGYTDYSTWDNYRKIYYPEPDRTDSRTLVQSGRQGGLGICDKANFLKPCFEKAVKITESYLAEKFLHWSLEKGYSPVRILMALSEQETRLGAMGDDNDHGVGLMQIISAFKTKETLVPDNDNSTWAGITHNILTNLEYAMRAAGVKIMENDVDNLNDLAFYYNGNKYIQRKYAASVTDFYLKIKGCGL